MVLYNWKLPLTNMLEYVVRYTKLKYVNVWRDVAHKEMMEAAGQMGDIIDDLGVGIIPDASPSLRFFDSEVLFNA